MLPDSNLVTLIPVHIKQLLISFDQEYYETITPHSNHSIYMTMGEKSWYLHGPTFLENKELGNTKEAKHLIQIGTL